MHQFMIDLLIFFMGASLFLYVVLGGADYGAGILELFPVGRFRETQKRLINQAMGPVWEANHMWLILMVVILFMGFPIAFQTIMTSLHIPMVALLIGIVIRGSVFAFRHYDAIHEPRSQKIYTILFGLSSLWTSFWFGIIAASLFRGNIDLATTDFWQAYMNPWLGWYPFAMGIFVIFNFTYLASIYLIGETKDEELKKIYSLRAFLSNIMVIVSGAGVFLASDLEGSDLFSNFIHNPISMACMIFATLLFFILWRVSKRQNVFSTRIIAVGQTGFILFGWFFIYAPNILKTKTGFVTFTQAASPHATLVQLSLALVIGSFFIFPSLFYLLRVFKGNSIEPGSC
jgi:cytochrome d ubiquinol oxidase subunit II